MKTAKPKQALCKEVISTLPESFMGIDTSHCNTSPSQYCKTKTCSFSPNGDYDFKCKC